MNSYILYEMVVFDEVILNIMYGIKYLYLYVN